MRLFAVLGRVVLAFPVAVGQADKTPLSTANVSMQVTAVYSYDGPSYWDSAFSGKQMWYAWVKIRNMGKTPVNWADFGYASLHFDRYQSAALMPQGGGAKPGAGTSKELKWIKREECWIRPGESTTAIYADGVGEVIVSKPLYLRFKLDEDKNWDLKLPKP